MAVLGRLIQILALLLLPIAMLMELTHFLGREFGVADLLIMLIFGLVLFYVGRLIEGYAARGNR